MDLETLRLVNKAFAYSPLLCSSEMTLGHEEYMKALTLGTFSICQVFTRLKPPSSLS